MMTIYESEKFGATTAFRSFCVYINLYVVVVIVVIGFGTHIYCVEQKTFFCCHVLCGYITIISFHFYTSIICYHMVMWCRYHCCFFCYCYFCLLMTTTTMMTIIIIIIMIYDNWHNRRKKIKLLTTNLFFVEWWPANFSNYDNDEKKNRNKIIRDFRFDYRNFLVYCVCNVCAADVVLIDWSKWMRENTTKKKLTHRKKQQKQQQQQQNAHFTVIGQFWLLFFSTSLSYWTTIKTELNLCHHTL